jgi:hypothetical protein
MVLRLSLLGAVFQTRTMNGGLNGGVGIRWTAQLMWGPNCDALYQLVKVEPGPETITDRKFPCRACGAPLDAHDGEFVLKYFLLRTAGRKQSWQKRSLSV